MAANAPNARFGCCSTASLMFDMNLDMAVRASPGGQTPYRSKNPRRRPPDALGLHESGLRPARSLALRPGVGKIGRWLANQRPPAGGDDMLRLGAFFILACMVLIAGCLGAGLYMVLGLSGVESTVIAVSVLTVLVVTMAMNARLRARIDAGAQIADLSRGTADIARQVAELA